MLKFNTGETAPVSFPGNHAALLIAILAVVSASACYAAPIVVPGGFELETSPNVILNTLYGPHMAYNATPIPLGTYDFGTGSGPVNVGSTSVIFARLNTFTLPMIGSTASVPVLLLAFSDRTNDVVPYSGFGSGATGSGHVTASVSSGYTPLGLQTITRTSDTGGTFTLTYKNEIAFTAEDGTLLSTSPVLSVTSANGTWQTTPPAGSVVIPGVNDYNFFFTNITLQNSIGNALVLTSAAAVPEPGSAVYLMFGVLPLAALYRRTRNITPSVRSSR